MLGITLTCECVYVCVCVCGVCGVCVCVCVFAQDTSDPFAALEADKKERVARNKKNRLENAKEAAKAGEAPTHTSVHLTARDTHWVMSRQRTTLPVARAACHGSCSTIRTI